MRWAFMQQPEKSADKFILLVLADRADEVCCCFPSIKRIHQDTLLDRKTIIASLKRLIETGFIRDTGERKGATKQVKVYQLLGVSNRYEREAILEMKKQRAVIAQQQSTPEKNVSKMVLLIAKKREKVTSLPDESVPSRPPKSTFSGTNNSTSNGTRNLSVEPIKEPISEKSQKTHTPFNSQNKKLKSKLAAEFKSSKHANEKYRGILLEDLPDGLSLAAAMHFIDHRIALKKPLTQYGFVLYLRALQACMNSNPQASLSLDAIVDETIDAGWQSIKPSWLANRLKPLKPKNHAYPDDDARPRKALCG